MFIEWLISSYCSKVLESDISMPNQGEISSAGPCILRIDNKVSKYSLLDTY